MKLTKRQYLILRILYKYLEKSDYELVAMLGTSEIVKKSYGFLALFRVQQKIEFLYENDYIYRWKYPSGEVYYSIAPKGTNYVERILKAKDKL